MRFKRIPIASLKTLTDALDVAAKITIAVIAGLWVLHTYPESRGKEFRKGYALRFWPRSDDEKRCILGRDETHTLHVTNAT
jgi:hypothetical protein